MCGACTRAADAACVHSGLRGDKASRCRSCRGHSRQPRRPLASRTPSRHPSAVRGAGALLPKAMRVLTQRPLTRSASCGCFEGGSCSAEECAAAAEARAAAAPAATTGAAAGGGTAAILSKVQAGRRRRDAGLRQGAGGLSLRLVVAESVLFPTRPPCIVWLAVRAAGGGAAPSVFAFGAPESTTKPRWRRTLVVRSLPYERCTTCFRSRPIARTRSRSTRFGCARVARLLRAQASHSSQPRRVLLSKPRVEQLSCASLRVSNHLRHKPWRCRHGGCAT